MDFIDLKNKEDSENDYVSKKETSFAFLNNTHKNLRNKYSFYDKWHNKPNHNKLNFIILYTALIIMLSLIFSIFFMGRKTSIATTYYWTQDSAEEFEEGATYQTVIDDEEDEIKLQLVDEEVPDVYYEEGTFTSSAFNTTFFADFKNIVYSGSYPVGFEPKFQIRTATTEAGLSSATWYGPTSTSDYYDSSSTTINSIHDGDVWIQYKIYFSANHITDCEEPYCSNEGEKSDGWYQECGGVTELIKYCDYCVNCGAADCLTPAQHGVDTEGWYANCYIEGEWVREFLIEADCSATQTNSTPVIESIQISYERMNYIIDNETITWDTTCDVGDLTLENGAMLYLDCDVLTVNGNLTMTGNSSIIPKGKKNTGQIEGQWQGYGVIINITGNASVESGSSINANGQGYVGVSASTNGLGPGGGIYAGTGSGNGGGAYAGYGGRGTYANTRQTNIYGNSSEPTDLGSSGGGYNTSYTSGAGGGAVKVTVGNTLTLNGTITANGLTGDHARAGAGSGGSVWVNTNVLSGSGSISANGATGNLNSGAGGGGRISIYYNSTNAGSNMFTASNSTGGADGGSGAEEAGGIGTAGFFDTSVTNNHLKVYKTFRYETQSETINLGAITVGSSSLSQAGTLEIAGGVTLNISTDLSLEYTGSTIIPKSKNNSAQVGGEWVGEGVIFNITGDVSIASGTSINANEQGYASVSALTSGLGPGGGIYYSTGAGNGGAAYGGYGGKGVYAARQTNIYGLATEPEELGSSGSGVGTNYASGAGGGAIKLTVGDILTINGAISANGGNAPYRTGAGSGGSVWINTGTLSGSGSVTANGGNGVDNSSGGGGGGRIAIYYTSLSSADNILTSSNALGGTKGGASSEDGQIGTTGFFDKNISGNHLKVYKTFRYDTESATYSIGAITVGSSSLSQAGTLEIAGGVTLNISTDLTLEYTGSTIIPKSKNNSAQVGGEWVGVGVTISVGGDASIASGTSINADRQGYIARTTNGNGIGPGGGIYASGVGDGGAAYGGYGGRGGGANTRQENTYGSATQPIVLGSSGGRESGGTNDGGGAIKFTVDDTLTINGTISANGGNAGAYRSGGGSGGSIWIDTGTLSGSGSVTANGGNGGTTSTYGGGGGGGRIAVYYNTLSSANNILTSSNTSGGTKGGGTTAEDGQIGTTGFFDKSVSGNHLKIYKTFRYDLKDNPPDDTYSIGAITVGSSSLSQAGTLEIAGGVTLNISTDLTLEYTGSTIIPKSKNNSAQVGGEWVGEGVTISVGGDASIASGTSINADRQGYVTPSTGSNGIGPGGGIFNTYGSSGGAHSGYGGRGAYQDNTQNNTYGSNMEPVTLGSSGGRTTTVTVQDISGGGAIKLTVGDTLTINGTISANGGSASDTLRSGGGSGGSIWIDTNILSGSGSVTTNGGNGSGTTTYQGGGGGGGRIVMYYNSTNAGSNLFTASNSSGGVKGGGTTAQDGQNGNTGFFDKSVSGNHLKIYKTFRYDLKDNPPDDTYSIGAITVGSSSLSQAGTLEIAGGVTLNISTDLTLEYTGSTIIPKSKNNSAQVGGEWVGEGVTINISNNLTIPENTSINASKQGYIPPTDYTNGLGPGGGIYDSTGSSGGAYGGYGGKGTVAIRQENTYGSATEPLDLGSSGGGYVSTQREIYGGGAIKLTISNTLTLNGIINADGGKNIVTSSQGGGSGGSVLINTAILTGLGSISAKGGDGATGSASAGGGGGGGRIAIYYTTSGNCASIDMDVSGGLKGNYSGAEDGGEGTANCGSKPTVTPITPDKQKFTTLRPSIEFTVTDLEDRDLHARIRYKAHSSNDCSTANMETGTTIIDSSSSGVGWTNSGVYTNTQSGAPAKYTFQTNLDDKIYYCWQGSSRYTGVIKNDNKGFFAKFIEKYILGTALAGGWDEWSDWSEPRNFETDEEEEPTNPLTNLSAVPTREKISEESDYEIKFTTPIGLSESGKTIVFTFPSEYDLTSVEYTDLEFSYGVTGTETEATIGSSAGDGIWGASINTTTNEIILTYPTVNGVPIQINDIVILKINNQQVVNPDTGGNYIIVISGTFGGYGKLAVPIISDDQIVVTGKVLPSLSFTISETNVYFGNINSSQARYATPGTEGSLTPPSNGAFMIQSISTNSANGLTLTTQSNGDNTTNAGLYSQVLSSLIEAKSISEVQTPDNTNGYAFAAKDASSTIGTLSIASGFQSETGNEIISRTAKTFATSTEPLSNAQVKIDLKLKISGLTPAGVYSDIITIICTGNY